MTSSYRQVRGLHRFHLSISPCTGYCPSVSNTLDILPPSSAGLSQLGCQLMHFHTTPVCDVIQPSLHGLPLTDFPFIFPSIIILRSSLILQRRPNRFTVLCVTISARFFFDPTRLLVPCIEYTDQRRRQGPKCMYAQC